MGWWAVTCQFTTSSNLPPPPPPTPTHTSQHHVPRPQRPHLPAHHSMGLEVTVAERCVAFSTQVTDVAPIRVAEPVIAWPDQSRGEPRVQFKPPAPLAPAPAPAAHMAAHDNIFNDSTTMGSLHIAETRPTLRSWHKGNKQHGCTKQQTHRFCVGFCLGLFL